MKNLLMVAALLVIAEGAHAQDVELDTCHAGNAICVHASDELYERYEALRFTMLNGTEVIGTAGFCDGPPNRRGDIPSCFRYAPSSRSSAPGLACYFGPRSWSGTCRRLFEVLTVKIEGTMVRPRTVWAFDEVGRSYMKVEVPGEWSLVTVATWIDPTQR